MFLPIQVRGDFEGAVHLDLGCNLFSEFSDSLARDKDRAL